MRRHFKYHLKWIALAVVALAAASCAPRAERAGAPAPTRVERALAFGRDSLWDDGLAELSLYSGSSVRGGVALASETRILVVKADLLGDELVASARGAIPGRTTEALEMIVASDLAGGALPAREVATLFFQRHALEVMKESASSFDGRGVSFVRAGPANGRFLHEAHTYREGEADRTVEVLWPLEDVPRLWRDGLPLWLRAAVAAGVLPPRAWMMPSQLAGGSPIESTRPVEIALAMSDGGPREVPAGRIGGTKRVDVTAGGRTDRYWFSNAFPHVMVESASAAGDTLKLKKTLRIRDWNALSPEDAARLR